MSNHSLEIDVVFTELESLRSNLVPAKHTADKNGSNLATRLREIHETIHSAIEKATLYFAKMKNHLQNNCNASVVANKIKSQLKRATQSGQKTVNTAPYTTQHSRLNSDSDGGTAGDSDSSDRPCRSKIPHIALRLLSTFIVQATSLQEVAI